MLRGFWVSGLGFRVSGLGFLVLRGFRIKVVAGIPCM